MEKAVVMKSKLMKCKECGRYAINDEAVFKDKGDVDVDPRSKSDSKDQQPQLIVINIKGANIKKNSIEKNEYNFCPECSGEMIGVLPPKFGLEDKYQKYRLDAFKEKIKTKFDYIFDQ
jgi:rRNA maturation protein Nop10